MSATPGMRRSCRSTTQSSIGASSLAFKVKDLKAAKPPATKRVRPRTMNRGLFSAKETTRSIIDRPASGCAALGGGAAGELPIQAMQEKGPLHHHLLAEVHAGDDAREPVADSLDFHLAPCKAAR